LRFVSAVTVRALNRAYRAAHLSPGVEMPDKETIERAERDKRAGKSPSTQAGEFVREEIHHIREGKHGARSTKQAIAIGLSKARRAGVRLPPQGKAAPTSRGRNSSRSSTRRSSGHPSGRRSRAMLAKLKKEGGAAASPLALSRHAHAVARRRGPAARSASARKAVRTKGSRGRKTAARKGARTRAARA
jgi:hypothetical protein